MRELKRITFFCLFFGIYFNSSVAQSNDNHSPVFSIKSQNAFELLPSSSIYQDISGSLSFNDVQNKNFSPLVEFQPSIAVNVYWVRLAVKSNLLIPSDWRLVLFDDWCEKVEVYSRTKEVSDQWLIQEAGYLCPIKNLDQNDRIKDMIRKVPNAVTLRFEAGEEQIIYIRYFRQNRETIRINPKLIPVVMAANQIIDYNRSSFFVILFMSMLCVLALYHLLVYFMTRDIAYFYYALYGFCAAFAATVMDEYGWLNYSLFYSNHPNIQPWVFNTIGIAAVVTYILFTRSFLETSKRFPKLDIAIKILMAWAILMGIVANFNYGLTDRQYIPGIPFSAFVILLAIVFGMILVSVLREKRVSDIFYVVGIGVIILMLLPIHLFSLIDGIAPEKYLRFFEPFSPLQIGLLIELIIFSLGLGYRTRQVEREKQRFEELDQMKSRFFANISHEFRTPLTLIMGPLQDIKEKTKNPKDRSLLQMAQRNAKRLLQLINQLLDLSKLEAGKMELRPEEQNLATLLKGIVMSFESLAKRKNIRIHFVAEKENILLNLDKDKGEKIFYNLLSNAFKFTKADGEVAVMIKDHKKEVEVIVRDNGIGISSDRLPYIFNRFFQVENTASREQEGTGIGLALVKEFVQLHDGTIRVESKENEGTSFIITFPKGLALVSQYENLKEEPNAIPHLGFLIDDNSELEESSTSIDILASSLKNISIENSKPIVLIIEDNSDVRTYIKQHLVDSFQIIEAINGEDGIAQAFEHLPDLIISDVMMPKKDGYAVCTILKTDQRTSHIPVILLTAKAASEEKMKGLETGADDYLVKPFDTKELEVRVRNLIELREKLRNRFSDANGIEPKAASTNSVDKIFLEKVKAAIEAHFSDDQFSVEDLAKAAGMSRVHLNRKLKALIDQSANKLIQSIRLQKAHIMLLEKAGNVSEIAISTGFRSSAYFVKCYGDKYGETPGAVLQA